jgi:hypothetical protein
MPQLRRLLAATAVLAAALATPASAHLTFFQSPAKNIHCLYLSTSGAPTVSTATVRCDVDFPTRFTRKPANCEFDFGGAFQVTARGHGRAICVSDSANSKTARKLVVGVPRHFGPITCKAPASRSVRCTSARGHGFLLSPTRQLVY